MKIQGLIDNEEPEVSIAPLIDCVFLLLIFFLVAGMTKVKNKDMDVFLPVSEVAVKLRPDDRQVVVGLAADGSLYWEGTPCSTNFLLERLRTLCVEDPERRIRLDLDRDVPFGRLVEIMDACQFYHLTNVGIRTHDEIRNTD